MSNEDKVGLYLEKLQADVSAALKLCDDKEICAALGARVEDFKKDLQRLQKMTVLNIADFSTNEFAYFRGPSAHERDEYRDAEPLLGLALSIFSQLSGMRYANDQ